MSLRLSDFNKKWGDNNNDSFYCGFCKRDERFEVSWVHHISSIGHQRVLSRLPHGGCGSWEENEKCKDRAIEVVGCQDLRASPVDIANYLTKVGGLIQEFVCPTSLSGTKPKIVSCLFKQIDSVDRILEVQDHTLFRQRFTIRRKYGGSEDKGNGKEGGHSQIKEQSEIGDGHVGDTVVGDQDDKTKTENDGDIATPINPQACKKQEEERLLPANLGPLEQQFVELQKAHKTDIRRKIAKELQKIFSTTFNNCIVFSYGTDFLGLSLDSDEMRFCVDPYGKFQAKEGVLIRNAADPMACGLVFQILSTYKQSDGTPQFTFVSQYSTHPSLDIPEMSFKFAINDSLISCKMQFENFMSVQKVKLLKFYCQHDPRVWSLFSLVRLWSKTQEVLHEIREGEEFEGYILIALMIFHLTNLKIIPSVADLQKLGVGGHKRILDNMDIAFCTDRKKVPMNHSRGMSDKSTKAYSVVSILQSFFGFFASLDFSDKVICPWIGRIVDRKTFRCEEDSSLPEDMLKPYRKNADGSSKKERLTTYTPVVIQDLLNLTDNIARDLDDSDIVSIKTKFEQTANALSKMLNEGHGNLFKFFGLQFVDAYDDEYDSASAKEQSDHETEATVEPFEPPSPGPPALEPPPFPFQMPGLPPISISLSPPRTLPPAPPPPKIGSLFLTPPPSSSSPARREEEPPVLIAQNPESHRLGQDNAQTPPYDVIDSRRTYLNGKRPQRRPSYGERKRQASSSNASTSSSPTRPSSPTPPPTAEKELVVLISRDPKGSSSSTPTKTENNKNTYTPNGTGRNKNNNSYRNHRNSRPRTLPFDNLKATRVEANNGD